MSPDTERIQVPTNGKGPPGFGAPPDTDDAPSQVDAPVAFTPAELAIGFGIIASLLVLLVGRLRRRGGSRR